jgi:hypothetical protein
VAAKEDPDYLAVAKQINRIELYRQAAAQVNVAVTADAMCSSRLMDGSVWDGKDVKGYAANFEVHSRSKELDSVP